MECALQPSAEALSDVWDQIMPSSIFYQNQNSIIYGEF
jgi:hypothetical protein